MTHDETVLNVVLSTTKRHLIDKAKDAINNSLLDLENRGNMIFWDIQETVKCAACNQTVEGYIRSDGAIMVKDSEGRGEYHNSWVWGCPLCREKEIGK